jgi:transcriptional regulator with XRE-family HTH domain
VICVGCQIAAARTLLRWSQAELAKAAGLTRNAVRYWEQAKVIPYGDDKNASRSALGRRDLNDGWGANSDLSICRRGV